MEIPKIYKDSDVDISLIQSKKVGIIGFGNQGRAHALNLRDSGIDVCIGVREGSTSRKLAQSDGLNCASISATLEYCDIIAQIEAQFNPSDCANFLLVLPSLTPIQTSIPLSRRFKACARP
jgi:ketol-acid reductoisomerase